MYVYSCRQEHNLSEQLGTTTENWITLKNSQPFQKSGLNEQLQPLCMVNKVTHLSSCHGQRQSYAFNLPITLYVQGETQSVHWRRDWISAASTWLATHKPRYCSETKWSDFLCCVLQSRWGKLSCFLGWWWPSECWLFWGNWKSLCGFDSPCSLFYEHCCAMLEHLTQQGQPSCAAAPSRNSPSLVLARAYPSAFLSPEVQTLRHQGPHHTVSEHPSCHAYDTGTGKGLGLFLVFLCLGEDK